MRIDTMLWLFALGVAVANLISGQKEMILAIIPTIGCLIYSLQK